MALPVSPVCSNRFPVAPPVTPPTEPSGGGNGRGGKGKPTPGGGSGPSITRQLVSWWDGKDATESGNVSLADAHASNDLTEGGAGGSVGINSTVANRFKIGQGLTCASSGISYMEKTSPAGLAPAGSWTAMLTARANTSIGALGDEYLMGIWDESTGNVWHISMATAANNPSGTQGFYVQTSNDGTNVDGELGVSSTNATDDWFMVFARYNSGSGVLRLRVDNGADVSVTGVSDLYQSSAAAFRLFNVAGAAIGDTFSGEIGQAAVWRREITDAECTALYNNGCHCTYEDVSNNRIWGYTSLSAAESSGDNWQGGDNVYVCSDSTGSTASFKYFTALDT